MQQPLDYVITLSPLAGCGELVGHLPGDCAGDGRIDLTDAICLLGYLFQGQTVAFPCAETPFDPGTSDIVLLDWDGNGSLDITDPIQLLGRLFLGGPPHVQARSASCSQVVP